jgi:hypothetical protein
LVGVESVQYLGYPCSADTQVTGKRCPILELAGIEQSLIVARELERIAAFFRSLFWLRFPE